MLAASTFALSTTAIQCGRRSGKTIQGAVIILLDTLRADHLSCYGYHRRTTPNIDALAQKGVRFNVAVSNSPWTLPSVGSLLTGSYPRNVFNDQGKLEWSLVESFQQHGYATAAVTEGGFVSQVFGLNKGFSFFRELEGPVQVAAQKQKLAHIEKGGIKKTFEIAGNWLRQHKNENFFLFIHTYEPHAPYTNHNFTTGMDWRDVGPYFPKEFPSRLQTGEMTLTNEKLEYIKALYDGDIANSDRYVGDFISNLKRLGLLDRTLVAITSDHGEELNDHYPSYTGDHGHSLRDPLIRVPLILYDPVNPYKRREISSQIRLMDAIPTIMDILHVKAKRSMAGKSLIPIMNADDADDRIVILGDVKHATGPPRIGVRTKDYKYILALGTDQGQFPLLPAPDQHQLYDLKADPGEQHNIAHLKQDVVNEMQKLLDAVTAEQYRQIKPDISKDADPKAFERLKSLGYVQ